MRSHYFDLDIESCTSYLATACRVFTALPFVVICFFFPFEEAGPITQSLLNVTSLSDFSFHTHTISYFIPYLTLWFKSFSLVA